MDQGNQITMQAIELVIQRVFAHRLENSIAAELTTAYETRCAAYSASGRPLTDEDRKRFKQEVLTVYYDFCGTISTINPRRPNP